MTASNSKETRRAAYARLIEEQEPTLLRTARRLCDGGEDQAQDLVQDALIKGYTAYLEGRFQPDSNARAWLLRIMTNGYITQYNHRQKWEAAVDMDTLTADGDGGPESLRTGHADSPEGTLLAKTLDEPLENALAALSPELRSCVVLVDIEELDYVQAAAALDVPVGTVRSRLFRARQRLHALLIEYARQKRLTPAKP